MSSGLDLSRDHLVGALLRKFEGADNVEAVDSRTLPRPGKIGRHAPDVRAEQHGRLLIGLAKTDAELDSEETVEQLREFTAARGANGQRAVVWLAIPAGSEDKARSAYSRADADANDELNEVLKVTISAS